MRDTPHPRFLPNNYRPSVIEHVDGGERFVASARITDAGYLSVVGWDGRRSLVPPHRVAEVERIDTERTSQNNTACKGIIADELAREALVLAGKVSEDDAGEEVIA
jgi:hypothetical protein